MTAKEETYSDPFAGLQTSPPSSPPSPDSKGPTKDQPDKQQQKTGLASKQAESAPLPAKAKTSSTTIHTRPPCQLAPSTLKKKVSFPDTLTRGRGSSYTPPEDDKAVRFLTSLVRGEGPSYNERNVKRDASTNGRRASSPQRLDSNVSQLTPDERMNDIAMETGDTSEDQATALAFDVESESDDSFTDVVSPIKAVEAVKTEPGPRRYECDPVYHRHPTYHSGHRGHAAGTTTSKRSSGSMQVKVSDSHGGYYVSEVLDDEPSHAGFDLSNKRRNSISGKHTSYSGLETPKRLGTATAPTYNRRGHRLRPSPIDTNILRQSSRRSWPEPVFVWKDTTTTSVLGRPNPNFALRERSESQKNIQASGRRIIAKSSQQQSGRKYQSPWVVDDVIDGAIPYDPTSKRTNRNV
ncbi:MAG: hypothetical protein Q9199_004551 [Rusavskia elegans]